MAFLGSSSHRGRTSKHHVPSSNPAPPLQNHMFSLEKRGFGDDSGDSLDDSPGSKAAHKTTQHLQAWTCMDRQESQSNWPEMRKTLGKPGFLSGEDRNRTTYKSPGKIGVSKRGGAKSDARRKYRQRTSDGSRIEGTRVCTRTTKAWPVWNSIPSTFHFLNSTH